MDHPLQSQIIEVEERLRQAMLHHDVSVLDQLISPDLLFTSHYGQLISKEDDLAFHRAGILNLKEAEPSQQQIRLYSDFAIVSVLMHLVGTYEGTPVDQQIRYTRIWLILPDGSIQLIAGHMSEVPPN